MSLAHFAAPVAPVEGAGCQGVRMCGGLVWQRHALAFEPHLNGMVSRPASAAAHTIRSRGTFPLPPPPPHPSHRCLQPSAVGGLSSWAPLLSRLSPSTGLCVVNKMDAAAGAHPAGGGSEGGAADADAASYVVDGRLTTFSEDGPLPSMLRGASGGAGGGGSRGVVPPEEHAAWLAMVQEWALDTGLEVVECCATQPHAGADKRDKTGVARVYEALQSTMWSNMVMGGKGAATGSDRAGAGAPASRAGASTAGAASLPAPTAAGGGGAGGGRLDFSGLTVYGVAVGGHTATDGGGVEETKADGPGGVAPAPAVEAAPAPAAGPADGRGGGDAEKAALRVLAAARGEGEELSLSAASGPAVAPPAVASTGAAGGGATGKGAGAVATGTSRRADGGGGGDDEDEEEEEEGSKVFSDMVNQVRPGGWGGGAPAAA
jgi:hypothetical protein